MKWIFNITLLILLVGCTGAKSPRALLENVLSKRQSNSLTQDYMLSITHGPLRDEVASMSEEDYDKYASDLGVTQGHYKILSENCESETKCTVTYILNYKSTENEEKIFSSEVKKVASLEKVDGNWKLLDMSNIKTYHEGLEPINPLEEN